MQIQNGAEERSLGVDRHTQMENAEASGTQYDDFTSGVPRIFCPFKKCAVQYDYV